MLAINLSKEKRQWKESMEFNYENNFNDYKYACI